ncbi:aldehyde dehydrogenase [Streptomyces sp. NPDC048527]|uniref:aldehyde dehydrogenase n=1 Tax=Streptomyces sp. NPDC048527 TaxID=3365568 RepID=UPI0037186DB5
MAELREHDRLFIGGTWQAPAGTEVIEVVSPLTGEVVGRVPHASRDDVDRAVAAAREAFDAGPWPLLPLEERIAVVERIGEGITARHAELAALISEQNGCPVTWAVPGQALVASAVVSAAVATARQFPFEERKQGMFGPFVQVHEPVGVVAAVVPWNVPLFAAVSKLAPALLAGCPVVLKPSPETPLDSFVLAEIAAAAGLPKGVLSILPADREVSEYLVAHPGVDKVSFTGSVPAGKRIMEVAAARLARVTLELGGKSAAVVLEDADLETVVQTVLSRSFVNNGQICVALTRVLVARSRYDEIAAALVKAVSALRTGPQHDPDTQVGPLVSRRQQQRVLDYIRIGREEGAELLSGGGVPAGLEQGCFVEPTLFGGDNTMRIAREEIFGPVVVLIPFEDEDEEEAVRLANDSDYGLAGTVFSADEERALRVARQIRSGTLGVNCARLDPLGTFGGFKESGLGRELGAEGLAAYTEIKTVHLPAEAPARA